MSLLSPELHLCPSPLPVGCCLALVSQQLQSPAHQTLFPQFFLSMIIAICINIFFIKKLIFTLNRQNTHNREQEGPCISCQNGVTGTITILEFLRKRSGSKEHGFLKVFPRWVLYQYSSIASFFFPFYSSSFQFNDLIVFSRKIHGKYSCTKCAWARIGTYAENNLNENS